MEEAKPKTLEDLRVERDRLLLELEIAELRRKLAGGDVATALTPTTDPINHGSHDWLKHVFPPHFYWDHYSTGVPQWSPYPRVWC